VDLFPILKTLHVLSAIVWVGGGLLAVTLGFRAARGSSSEALLAAMAQMGFCGGRIFMPASLATLVFGLGMTWVGNLWLDVWVLIGLGGIGVLIVLGATVLGPRIGHVLALHAEGKTDEAVRLARKVLLAACFDGTLLVVIVIDMVLKPTLGEWPILAAFAAVALASALVFMPRALAPVMRAHHAL
jgi:uncharacterized membrane protein